MRWMNLKSLFFFTMAGFIGSCAAGPDAKKAQSSQKQPASCNPSNSSFGSQQSTDDNSQFNDGFNQNTSDGATSFQMTGGQISERFRSVVLLARRTSSSLKLCSGTFVGPNVIATAAHCVDSSPRGGVTVSTATRNDPEQVASNYNAAIQVKQVIAANNPSLYDQPASQDAEKEAQLQAADFALIITQGNNDAPAIALMDEAYSPAFDTPFNATVVGYGRDEDGYVGNRREGSIVIERTRNTTTTVIYQNSKNGGSTAAVQSGDSGGAVMLNGKLIGVTTNDNNVSLPINSPRIQAAINEARQSGAVFGNPQGLGNQVQDSTQFGNCLTGSSNH